MAEILYIVSKVVSIAIFVIQICMTIRAVLSWLPIDDNKFTDFIYGVTEPFVYPFRVLFQRLNWFQQMPLDMAFTFAWLTLTILGFIL